MAGIEISAPARSSTALRRAEEWLPVGAVVLLAVGIIVLLMGAGAGEAAWALAGGLAAGGALVLLVAHGSVDGLMLLGLSLPLPALLSGDGVRISLAGALTAVLIGGWVIAHATEERPFRSVVLPTRAAAAFLAAILLSTLFSQHKLAAVRELTDLSLMIGLLIVATHQLSRRPSTIRRLVTAIAAVAGLTGAFAVLQTLGLFPNGFPLPGTSLYRATAGFGWPNELGMFMAMALPLSIHVYHQADKPAPRLVAFVLLAAAAIGLALTFSRGSWLGFVAAIPVLLLVGDRRFTFRALVGIAVAVALIDLLFGGVVRERVAAISSDPYVGQRLALMLTGLLMFRAHPIVGVGPGGFAESLPDFGPQVPWLWDYVGSTHNAYLEFAAETGVIGLAAFVALLVAVLGVLLKGARRGHETSGVPAADRSLRRALLWSFATFCTVSFTGWPFAHGVGQLAILVAAMGFALESHEQAPTEADTAEAGP